MGIKDLNMQVLQLNDVEVLKSSLKKDSGLPGPRGNLKTVESFSKLVAEEEKSSSLYMTLTELWLSESNGNDPEAILVLSGLLVLSHYYSLTDYRESVKEIFINAMNDERWRVREIIQESFKVIAHQNYDDLIELFDSIQNPTMLEYRAMITTLAHPEILKTKQQIDYSFVMLDKSLAAFLVFEETTDLKSDSFIALRKGLSFAPSVIIVSDPVRGFKLIENYINKSKVMNRVIKENMKKNRLAKNHQEKCINIIDDMTCGIICI